MSSTLSSPSTPSSCALSNYNLLPITDIACAIPILNDASKSTMSTCCKTGAVSSFANDCALFCPVIGQTVADLSACLQENGVSPGSIRCNGTSDAKASVTTGSLVVSATETGTARAEESKGAGVRGFGVQGDGRVGWWGVVVLGGFVVGAVLGGV